MNRASAHRTPPAARIAFGARIVLAALVASLALTAHLARAHDAGAPPSTAPGLFVFVQYRWAEGPDGTRVLRVVLHADVFRAGGRARRVRVGNVEAQGVTASADTLEGMLPSVPPEGAHAFLDGTDLGTEFHRADVRGTPPARDAGDAGDAGRD